MGTVLADTAHEELLDAALIVFGHHYSWSIQIMSSDTDDLTNGILVSVEVCDLNLMRDRMCLSLGDKSLLNEILCFADLQHVMCLQNLWPLQHVYSLDNPHVAQQQQKSKHHYDQWRTTACAHQ